METIVTSEDYLKLAGPTFRRPPGEGRPRRALALAHLGRIAEAQAEIAPVPDCYSCVLARAQVAELAGDRPGADRWFGRAVAMAPSRPMPQTEWAKALLGRGDLAGAMAKAEAANRKSPHYADALEVWGEALLAKGDVKGAAAKFAEADRHAPKWGRNHLRWGQALARDGKPAEAREQWRIAQSLEMSAADRAELARVQGR